MNRLPSPVERTLRVREVVGAKRRLLEAPLVPGRSEELALP
ncbi:hypothetical protein [Natrinema sp. 1APR25-10V2]|nr:hypothetical protein [Natrinema sp. 1APR25-10V2]